MKSRNKPNLKVLTLSLLFAVSFTLAQDIEILRTQVGPYVFKIRASDCQHGQEMSLTGFLVKDHQGIMTALHGVVGCDTIAALNSQDVFTNLTLEQVDFDKDIALISSDELRQYFNAHTQACLDFSNNYLGTTVSLGYPLDLGQLIDEEVRIRLSDDGSIDTQLLTIIPPEDRSEFNNCLSPNAEINVFNLEAILRPGESGAPLLNSDKEVIGIIMGGIIAANNIAWATRADSIELKPKEAYQTSLDLRASTPCFTNRFSELGANSDPLKDVEDDVEKLKRQMEGILNKNQEFLEQDPLARQEYFEVLESVLYRIRLRNAEVFNGAQEALEDERIDDFNKIIDLYSATLAEDTEELEGLSEAIGEQLRAKAREYFDLAITVTFLKPQASLEYLLEAARLDPASYEAFTELGSLQLRLGQTESALVSFEEALRLSKIAKDESHGGVALGRIGAVHYVKGNYDNAIRNFELSFEILLSKGDFESAFPSLIGIADVHESKGEYKQAKVLYEEALFFAHVFNSTYVGAILGRLGTVSRDLGDYQEALDYYRQLANLGRSSRDPDEIRAAVAGRGEVYLRMGRLHEAIEDFEEALAISREIAQKEGIGANLSSLGNVHLSLGQFDKALQYHQDALRIAREIGNKDAEGVNLGNIGIVHAESGNYEEAISYHEESLQIAREVGNRVGEAASLGNLGVAQRNLENHYGALDYFQKALNIAVETEHLANQLSILAEVGTTYGDLGFYDEAQRHLEEALNIATAIGYIEGEGKTLTNLAMVHLAMDETDITFDYLEKAYEAFVDIDSPYQWYVLQLISQLQAR